MNRLKIQGGGLFCAGWEALFMLKGGQLEKMDIYEVQALSVWSYVWTVESRVESMEGRGRPVG